MRLTFRARLLRLRGLGAMWVYRGCMSNKKGVRLWEGRVLSAVVVLLSNNEVFYLQISHETWDVLCNA